MAVRNSHLLEGSFALLVGLIISVFLPAQHVLWGAKLLGRVVLALCGAVNTAGKAFIVAFFYDQMADPAPPIPDPFQLRAFTAFENAYRTGEADALEPDLNLKAFEAALAYNMAYWEACHAGQRATLARLQSRSWRDVLWGYIEFTQLRTARGDELPFGVAMPAQIDGLETMMETQAATLARMERNQVQVGMQAIVDRVAAARASGDMSGLSGTTARPRGTAFLYTETNARITPSRTRLRHLTSARYIAWNKYRYAASRAYCAWWWRFRDEFNDTVDACMWQITPEREQERWSAVANALKSGVERALAPPVPAWMCKFAVMVALFMLMPVSAVVGAATNVHFSTIRMYVRVPQGKAGV